MIQAICFVARGIIKENKKVIGIATEMKIKPTCSYDFCFLEIPIWTEGCEKQMKDLQKKMSIWTNKVFKHIREDEFPNIII